VVCEKFRPAIVRLLWNRDDQRRSLATNVDALIDYGAGYRSKLPISTSRAEGCVDEIANARVAKKQRMRWSPRRAHWVATVRARSVGRPARQQLISSWWGQDKIGATAYASLDRREQSRRSTYLVRLGSCLG
jgi:hypothetical protein